MTAKEYLGQALELNKKINHMQLLYEAVKADYGFTTRLLDGMPKNPNVSVTQVCDQAIRSIEMNDEINGEIDRLIALRNEIADVIWEVPDLQERVILYGRYVNFYSWEKIAQDMGYSERHVLRLHGSALEKVQIP
jgi:DNA-directed RNA polymerase specialized sigma subunit